MTIPGTSATNSSERFFFRNNRHLDFNGNVQTNVNYPQRVYDSNGNDLPATEGMIVFAYNQDFGSNMLKFPYMMAYVHGKWRRFSPHLIEN